MENKGYQTSKAPATIAIIIFLIILGAMIKTAMREPELTLPLGLDKEAYIDPEYNKLTPQRIELGRFLYFDTRLSPDDTVACASCHAPSGAFTDNAPVSTGINGQKGGRSAPTVINRAFTTVQFWDGRAATLEEQAKGPLTNPIEHGFGSNDDVVAKIKGIKGYIPLFMDAYGEEPNIENIAKAIASFERVVLSGNSRFDQYQNGDAEAMSGREIRGMKLFNDEAKCAACHSGFNFSDENFHNLGIGMDAENPDLGRYVVTNDEDDKGAFKTPTLRDIEKTAPYMHDGSLATLEEVVHYYNIGGNKNEYLSPLIEPLGLNETDEADIVAFMKTLNGTTWQKISAPSGFPQ